MTSFPSKQGSRPTLPNNELSASGTRSVRRIHQSTIDTSSILSQAFVNPSSGGITAASQNQQGNIGNHINTVDDLLVALDEVMDILSLDQI